MKWNKIMVLMTCCMLLLSGCATKNTANAQKHEAMTFAMDTLMMLTVYDKNGEQILVDAEQEIRRLENLLSVTIEDSDIAKLNHNAGKEAVAISDDTMSLLQVGNDINVLTNGCYDMTVSPIVKAWGFTEETHKVPSQQEIDILLPLVNHNAVTVDTENKTAYLEQDKMAVDLGGIAKGYTSDCVVNLLKEKGVSSAIISLGGNVAAVGNKPDGSPWKIAVENPLNNGNGDYVGLLTVTDKFAVTSGGYQRYFEQDGKKYHHIIDPHTGYPAESGLISVTIVCDNGTKADGLSTALFVMGLEKGLDLWRQSDDFEVIFITDDHKVIATEGIAEQFAFSEEDNDFVYEIAKR